MSGRWLGFSSWQRSAGPSVTGFRSGASPRSPRYRSAPCPLGLAYVPLTESLATRHSYAAY